MVGCSLCYREYVEGGYCRYHWDAHANLVEAYEAWKKSIGLSWNAFLEEVIKTNETGKWAKDVSQDLLSKGSAGD